MKRWFSEALPLPTLVAKQEYDFAHEQQRCFQLIDKFTSRSLDEDWPENPIFGRVSGRDSQSASGQTPGSSPQAIWNLSGATVETQCHKLKNKR
jgi:hypothetical protein